MDMKEIIAGAARKLILEKKVKKLTVKDIVEECQITRQAFYYHFEGIPDLIQWSIGKGVDRLLEETRQQDGPEAALKYLFVFAINAMPDVRRGVESNYGKEVEQTLRRGTYELFEQIVSEKLSGVVLETFGEGNIPSNNRTLVSSIRRASENGAIVSVCSQCYRGTTKLGTYATSNALKESGAVGCNDMTTEAAVTKLYYLFSCGYPKETIKKLMTTNLRGEISM